MFTDGIFVFLCMSFPAIFIGALVAAWVTGNTRPGTRESDIIQLIAVFVFWIISVVVVAIVEVMRGHSAITFVDIVLSLLLAFFAGLVVYAIFRNE